MDWIAPLTALTAMEIVLGVDNIIFIAILAQRLPAPQQKKARTLGLIAALVMRLALLAAISWIMQANTPLFTLEQIGVQPEWLAPLVDEPDHHGLTDEAHDASKAAEPESAGDDPLAELSAYELKKLDEINGVSTRDLILLFGGLFLIFKSVREIHHKLDPDEQHLEGEQKQITMGGVLFQIVLLDIVFSLDSVITAVGMAEQLWVMMTAVVIAVGFMIFAAGAVSRFVERHPTVKILALSFLILIGFTLTLEGFGAHISKGYVYFAMIFALGVELINLKVRKTVPQAIAGTRANPSDAAT